MSVFPDKAAGPDIFAPTNTSYEHGFAGSTTILDHVAAMTKIAAKKTAGVLGDDLTLNAEQVSGVKADRELPVV